VGPPGSPGEKSDTSGLIVSMAMAKPMFLGRGIFPGWTWRPPCSFRSLAGGIDQRPTRIARVDRGVGLEQSVRFSVALEKSAWADKERPVAETIPLVTVGRPGEPMRCRWR